MYKQQRGGTILGVIIGVVLGLAAALGVAVYVTKVPVPFLTKDSQKDYEASEAERNRNWDPNSPLYGKNPSVRGAVQDNPAQGQVSPAPQPPAVAVMPSEPVNQPATSISPPLPGQPSEALAKAEADARLKARAEAEAKRGSGDPLGDLANARIKAAEAKVAAAAPANAAAAASADGFNYFVQAGAFRAGAEADAQRAKLAMLGWEARVTEREQNGRPVFRVRVGPFDKRGDAEQLKQKLDGAGVDSALVRVQR